MSLFNSSVDSLALDLAPRRVMTASTSPPASPPPAGDDEAYAAMRAQVEAATDALREDLLATAAEMKSFTDLAGGEDVRELLAMRFGIEEEMASLRRETRRLEAIAELGSMEAAETDGGDDEDVETRRAASRARLAAMEATADEDAAAARAAFVAARDENGGSDPASTSFDAFDGDDEEALDRAIAEMDERLDAARASRNEMVTRRRELEAELDAFVLMAREDEAEEGAAGEIARAFLKQPAGGAGREAARRDAIRGGGDESESNSTTDRATTPPRPPVR